MANPLSNGPGPQRTSSDSSIVNYFKPKLDKVAEFMGDVALRIPIVGSWVSDYRANKFIAQLPNGMTEDQAKTADITRQLASRTLSIGESAGIIHDDQAAIEARLKTKTEIERNIKSLKTEIDRQETLMTKNNTRMEENRKNGLHDHNIDIYDENTHLMINIRELKKEITNLEILNPERPLEESQKDISKLNISQLRTLLQEARRLTWTNQDQTLNPLIKTIENRINEIKNNK